MLKAALILVVLSTMVPLTAGCADSSAEQDDGREAGGHARQDRSRSGRSRSTAPSKSSARSPPRTRSRSPRRPKASSAACSPISAIPSRPGQTLVEIDREKLQYSLDQQKAALARALTSTAPPTSASCRRSRRHPTSAGRPPSSRRRSRPRARRRAAQAAADSAAGARRRGDDAATRSRRAYDAALQNARNLRADIDASDATREARRSPVARRLHPRAVRRLRPEADGVGRRAGEGPDAGDDRRARRSAEAAGEIPERMAPWIKVGQSVDAAGRRVSGQTFAATVSRISPARQHPDADVRVRGARRPTPTALLKPGTFARVHLETALVEQVLTIPYAAMQYRYGVYRVFIVDGDRLDAPRAEDRRPGRRSHGNSRRREARRSRRAHRRRQPGRRHEGRRQRRDGVAMLSELCVRRPVFATMLVMSLVVLGIFSFRDLGVDLFPKADPATVNVSLRLPGASPDEMTIGGHHADGERAQRHRRHRPDVGQRATPAAPPTSPSGSCSSATSTTPPTRAREGRRRDADRAARGAAADHPEAGSGRRSDHEHRALGQDARACARSPRSPTSRCKRALESVDGVGAVTHQRRPAARDPHRRRRREAERARPVDRPGARRDSERRTSRFPAARSSRASGKSGCARSAASTPPISSTTSSSPPSTARRCGSPTSATPRTRRRR